MHRRRWTVVIPICAILFLPGCRDLATEEARWATNRRPWRRSKGSDLSRVVLKEDAARRIGLDTVPTTGRGGRTVVPESAIWVDVNGDEWVYTNPEALVFVRAQVVVDTVRRRLGLPLGWAGAGHRGRVGRRA